MTPRHLRSAPRTFLELVDTAEVAPGVHAGRTFLVEYEFGDASAKATAEATRLNALPAVASGPAIDIVEGPRWPSRLMVAVLVLVVTVSTGGWWMPRARRSRLAGVPHR